MASASQTARILEAFLSALGLGEIAEADPGIQSEMLRAANAASEEICTDSPSNWYREDEFGEIVRAPTTISIQVTAGSKAYTWADLSANSWARNCAITIDGDPIINRLHQAASTAELLYPYGGSSGTKTAVIYNDVIQTPVDFKRFKGCLSLVGRNDLVITDQTSDLEQHRATAYGNSIPMGIPQIAKFVARYTSRGERLPHIKFDCLPSVQMRLYGEFYQKVAMIEDWTTPRYDLVPDKYVASVLIPWSLGKLLEITTSPLTNPEGIMRAWQRAVSTLADLSDVTAGAPGAKIKSDLF